MARERSRGWRRRRRRDSPCAQTLIQTAWRGSARAASWMLPGVDFTAAPPGAPQTALLLASSRATQAPVVAPQAQGRKLGEAPDRRRMVATDPEGEHHPDLLGGEDSAISNWRHWKRRWRRSFCPSIGSVGHRSRPGWLGDGGGDPDRQRGDGREREVRE
jgi:hypothetical protein